MVTLAPGVSPNVLQVQGDEPHLSSLTHEREEGATVLRKECEWRVNSSWAHTLFRPFALLYDEVPMEYGRRGLVSGISE